MVEPKIGEVYKNALGVFIITDVHATYVQYRYLTGAYVNMGKFNRSFVYLYKESEIVTELEKALL